MRIDQINAIAGFPEKVKNVPPNYPTVPKPGKISLLFNYNSQNLYHRFSPYTYGDNVFGLFRNKQPFVYRYPDEAQNSTFNQLPAAVKTLAAAGNITQGTMDDVVRVSKFLVSSPEGALYNIKQVGLQRLNVFDETRVYNPLTPILATISGMTFGIGERPVRHIEGGFLTGLLNSVTSAVGINFQSGFQKPDSTAGGASALPTANTGQGKGMIRGATATSAKVTLTSKWPSSPAASTSTLSLGGAISNAASSFLDSAKGALSTFFGSAKKSKGIYRADEATYELMRVSKGKLDSYGKDGNPVLLKVNYHKYYFSKEKSTGIYPIGSYGHDVVDLSNSQILGQYYVYSNPQTKYPSKFNDPQSDKVKEIEENLKGLINGINNYQGIGAGGNLRIYNTLYVARPPTNSLLMSSGDPLTIGYDAQHAKVPKRPAPVNTFGTIGEYNSGTGKVPATVDSRVNPGKSLRFSTTFTSDGINQLGLIGADMKIPYNGGLGIHYKNWVDYKPYDDDLIAFFFYDVVNQKYIPFRATVKGISEGNTAFWDELRFIGRADQLYSYNGFSRTLSFTFNIVISSISELLPTWRKVNYMASCVKPSNYTSGAKFGDIRFSQFIIPPMFMLTIGDFYKYQPIVITSINVNVPDDAAWETLNEINAPEGWSYLNGIITTPQIGKGYAQLPREVEIAITCNLLEKERAILGGSHFGHAPRKDDWETSPDGKFVVGGQPFLPEITQFHAEEVVFNPGAPVPVTLPVPVTPPASVTPNAPFKLLSTPNTAPIVIPPIPFSLSRTNSPTAGGPASSVISIPVSTESTRGRFQIP